MEDKTTFKALGISHGFPRGFVEDLTLQGPRIHLFLLCKCRPESQKCFPRDVFILFASVFLGLAGYSHRADPVG